MKKEKGSHVVVNFYFYLVVFSFSFFPFKLRIFKIPSRSTVTLPEC
jgi:hypothetical protein